MSPEFSRPREAPVFCPSVEEFGDPLLYIRSIADIARNFGVCKIRPPRCWKPPFCVDQTRFTFSPRIQHLSDLSAFNRVKNDFICQIVSFWEAQDVQIFTPYIKGKVLDVFRLWKCVQSHGGFDSVCKNKLWCVIGGQLGFDNSSHVASAICLKYKKTLLPYERFLANREGHSGETDSNRHRTPNTKKSLPMRKLTCSVCGLGENEDRLLICNDCETAGAHHTYCLQPPLSDIPKTSWFCPRCLTRRFNRIQKTEPFGFTHSKKRRNLSQFGNFADEFMTKHFGKPFHMVNSQEIEKEFWRLMNAEHTDVVVEYGTDLNSSEFSSGFPVECSSTSKNRKYADNPWNLNNISVGRHSALRFLPRNISGMIIPWCYVGMVFSCFCWHTEDHWSYSINYLHSGSPKTWYGVPTDAAEAFEHAMRAEFPELFQASPDLLHHMTTMVCPSVLESRGVPIYTLDQLAGEFVITFPRAYHSGFNQGFNFAEAVNFCPADWFTLGRYSIEHYAVYHRPPVFAHAELLCRMAQSEELLSVDFLAVVTEQLKELLASERSLRRHLARLGVRRTERLVFEDSDEPNRCCKLCNTVLYLSALACKCSSSMVCLGHYQALDCCAHEEQVMRYRFGLDELSEFIDKLDAQLQDYRRWQRSANQAFQLMRESTSVVLATVKETGNDINEINDTMRIPKPEEDPPSLLQSEEKPSTKYSSTNDCLSNIRPSLSELKDLLEIGRARNYPQFEVNKFAMLLRTIDECAVVVRNILRSYCAASVMFPDRSEKMGLKEDDLDSGCTSSSLEDTLKCSPNSSSTSSDVDSTGADETEAVRKTRPIPLLSTPSKNNKDITSPKSSMKTLSVTVSTKYGMKERHADSWFQVSRNKSECKVSLEEFAVVLRTASRLESYLPETEDLRRMNRDIEEWRQRVLNLISYFESPVCSDSFDGLNDKPPHDLTSVDQLIKLANEIPVDLPESLQLKRIQERLAWKDLVDRTLGLNYTSSCDLKSSQCSKPSLDYLCDLQLSGDMLSATVAYVDQPPNDRDESNPVVSVPPRTRLDRLLVSCSVNLLKVIQTAKVHEEKLLSFKNNVDGTVILGEVLSTIEQAETLPVWLPILNEIKQMCEQAQLIDRQCEQISKLLVVTPLRQSVSPLDPRAFEGDLYDELALGTIGCTSSRWKSVVSSLVDQERILPIRCPQIQHVFNLITFIDQCRERLRGLFLLPHTESSLLEVLLPRSASSLELLVGSDTSAESVSSPSVLSLSKRLSSGYHFTGSAYAKLCRENAEDFAQTLVTCEDIGHMYDSFYTGLIESELSAIRRLRMSNMQKSKVKRQNQVAYCVCRKLGFVGFMVQCELCRDWFHGRCVMLPNLKDSEADRLRYMCPRCERTLRPELEQVLIVLDDLMRSLPTNFDTHVSLGSQENSRNRNARMMCLARLPEFVALQMLCERAFLFMRRLRGAIQSNPELSQAIYRYERFAGVRMPLFGCIEELQSPMCQSEPRAEQPEYNNTAAIRIGKTTAVSRNDQFVCRDGIDRRASSTSVKTSAKLESLSSPSKHLDVTFGPRSIPTGEDSLKDSISSKPIRGDSTQFVVGDEHIAAEALAGMSSHPSSVRANSPRNINTTNAESVGRAPVRPLHPRNEQDFRTAGLKSASLAKNTFASTFPKAIRDRPQMSNLTDCPPVAYSGLMKPPSHLPVESTRLFHCSLPCESRKLLETLLMEATLLEVSIPQTRWLWQLHLASDPDAEDGGAVHPYVARVEERRLKRRFVRQLEHSGGSRKLFGGIKRTRARRLRSANEEHLLSLRHDESDSTGSDELLPVKQSKYSPERAPVSSRSAMHAKSLAAFSKQKLRSVTCLGSSVVRRYEFNRPGRLHSVRRRQSFNRFGLSSATVKRFGTAQSYRSAKSLPKRHSVRETDFEVGLRKQPLSSKPQYRAVASYRSPRPSRLGNNQLDAFSSSTNESSNDFKDQHVELPGSSHCDMQHQNRVLPRKRRPARPQSVKQQVVPTESRSDEAICAADECHRPRTGTVEWIACDTCDEWYHQVCVGIRPKAKVPERYVCPRCHKQSMRSNLHDPLSDSRRSSRREAPVPNSSVRLRGSRRQSKLSSSLAQRPVGWNTSASIQTPPHEKSEMFDLPEVENQWADYSPTSSNGDDITPVALTPGHTNSTNLEIESCRVTEEKVTAESVQANDPTEVLLQAIDVVNASDLCDSTSESSPINV